MQALLEAVKLAKNQHACLRLVHVVNLGPLYPAVSSGPHVLALRRALLEAGQDILDEAAALAQSKGVTVEKALRWTARRRISEKIVEDARRWPADLIVLGTHGRHGIERLFLGSVAEGVARTAPVPVLLVRGSTGESAPSAGAEGADSGADPAKTCPASSGRT
ncbi:MAG: universal stress protein [Chloroflexota bacterium]